MQILRQTNQKGAEIILRILFFSVLFMGVSIMMAGAQEEISSEDVTYDSIYRYNALENTISHLTMEEIVYAASQNEKNVEEEINTSTLKEETIKAWEHSKQVSEKSMEDIERKMRVESILTGTTLGTLRFQLVQIKDQIYELKTLAKETEDLRERYEINIQVEEMGQVKSKVENFILARENKFSFFGWFVSML